MLLARKPVTPALHAFPYTHQSRLLHPSTAHLLGRDQEEGVIKELCALHKAAKAPGQRCLSPPSAVNIPAVERHLQWEQEGGSWLVASATCPAMLKPWDVPDYHACSPTHQAGCISAGGCGGSTPCCGREQRGDLGQPCRHKGDGSREREHLQAATRTCRIRQLRNQRAVCTRAEGNKAGEDEKPVGGDHAGVGSRRCQMNLADRRGHPAVQWRQRPRSSLDCACPYSSPAFG